MTSGGLKWQCIGIVLMYNALFGIQVHLHSIRSRSSIKVMRSKVKVISTLLNTHIRRWSALGWKTILLLLLPVPSGVL